MSTTSTLKIDLGKDIYPHSYHYLLNKTHKISMTFNTEPYILNLETGEIVQSELPEKWEVLINKIERNDDGSATVTVYNYRNKKIFRPPQVVTSTLYYRADTISEIETHLVDDFHSNPLSNTIVCERLAKINDILHLFKEMYKTLFIKKDIPIKIKKCHLVTSKHNFKESLNKKSSMYLSLTNKITNTDILLTHVFEKHKAFIHDTIEYLIRIQLPDNIKWLFDTTLDVYLEALSQTHIAYDGTFLFQFVIYSFFNDNFFYYSRNDKTYYKTQYIRFCYGKNYEWTVHFGSEKNDCIQKIDIDKLLAVFDLKEKIKRYS